MAPDGSTNLAVTDVVNALKFLHKVVPSFGGNPSQVTVAGQSSGAGMIRALLATPSASSYFQSAILQSDPMVSISAPLSDFHRLTYTCSQNFGFLTPSTQVSLQSYYNGLVNCSASDTSCLNALSLDSILNAQTTLFDDAASIDASAGVAEPIRPVRDGSLITTPLDSSAAFPSVSKPLLLSNVRNEAGLTIYGSFSSSLATTFFEPAVDATLGDARTDVVVDATFYTPATLGTSDARTQLEVLGTDYMWRCATWTLARDWVQNGGTAYVGLYTVGATYPGNDAVSFCTSDGAVCHQDDIEIVVCRPSLRFPF